MDIKLIYISLCYKIFWYAKPKLTAEVLKWSKQDKDYLDLGNFKVGFLQMRWEIKHNRNNEGA